MAAAVGPGPSAAARGARRALAALTALAALVVAGCSSTVRVPGPTRTATTTIAVEDPSYVWSTTTVTVTKQAPKPRTATRARAAQSNGFTYKISADSGSATNITYMKDGDIVQDTGVSLPWSKTVDACGTLCIVSAQNAGSGRITCEIDGPDGVEDRSASTGAYAVVNCQA